MYQALYRKWRPQTFDEVIGQKHITETLKNQVKTGRLSHAYIFIGTRGTGKTTCARILAKAVNCEHPVNGNPCGKCPACLGISDGSVLDVVELDAASNNGVDNVRALREEAVFSPAAVKKRVYIIDEVHMLSASAFNALLKILEEPPEHLMFILATTELHKVPATILSRCQRHIFHRIDTSVIGEYLQDIAARENFQLTKDGAELIARLADGGVRDALSLLDQCSASEKIDTNAVYAAMGLAGNRRIAQMLDNILKKDSQAVLKEFAGMWMDGKDPSTLLSELSALMRDILMMQVAPKGGLELISGGYESEMLKDFGKRMTRDELICAMSTIQRYMAGLRDAKNPRTAVELCLISLCDNTLGDSIEELKARISRLERNMAEGNFAISGRASYEEPDDYERPPLEEPPDFGEPPVFEAPPAFKEPPVFREPAPYEPEPRREKPPVSAPPPLKEERPAVKQPARPAPEPLREEAPPQPVSEPEEDIYKKNIEEVLKEPPKQYFEDAAEDEEIDFGLCPEEQPDSSRAQSDSRDEARDELLEEFFSDAELWSQVCKSAGPKLPMDIRFSLEDDKKVRARVEGSCLCIDVLPGFTYERFNRQEVLKKLTDAAKKISGRAMRVKLGKLEEEKRSRRSLDELKEFKEVRFI